MGLVTHEATANMCMLLMKGYFAAGMGITEARQYHQHKLELTDNEAMLADATVNPKYRTVLHWHTTWRAQHYGASSGRDMIEVILVDIFCEGVSNPLCFIGICYA